MSSSQLGGLSPSFPLERWPAAAKNPTGVVAGFGHLVQPLPATLDPGLRARILWECAGHPRLAP